MDIRGKTCLLLGGTGQVGLAVAQQLFAQEPSAVVISGLGDDEVAEAVESIKTYATGETKVLGVAGNVFMRSAHRHATPRTILTSQSIQKAMIADVLGQLSRDIVERSLLYELFSTYKPALVVDSINTATAVAYQNIYKSGAELTNFLEAGDDEAIREALPRLLATLSVPQLIRHVQILWECMLRFGTETYLKVGTTGTGGMGLNIPYTHGEERPSRVLLSKTALSGAHTMLLFLAARTPGGPAVKELKPAALIAWKAIGFGPVCKRRRPIPLFDCDVARALPLEEGATFNYAELSCGVDTKGVLEAPFIDTGENGVFSAEEFKAITLLNQMETITPEEIAEAALWEIQGRNSGRDVVGALDSAIMGPTYRAAVLRQEALAQLADLTKHHPDNVGIAFEILGPPRLSKLLFEGYLLRRCYGTVTAVADLNPGAAALALERVVSSDPNLRRQALSVGVPILLPGGDRLLFASRGNADHDWETKPWTVTDAVVDRFAENEWIDLRAENMDRWSARARRFLKLLVRCKPENGSAAVADVPKHLIDCDENGQALLDPGHMVGWLFSHEDKGGRMKR